MCADATASLSTHSRSVTPRFCGISRRRLRSAPVAGVAPESPDDPGSGPLSAHHRRTPPEVVGYLIGHIQTPAIPGGNPSAAPTASTIGPHRRVGVGLKLGRPDRFHSSW